VLIATLTLLVLAGGFGIIRLLRSEYWKSFSMSSGSARAKRTDGAPELKRLTYDSKAFDPVISPDGHSVAYKFQDGDQISIKLKNIINGSTIEVLPPTGEEYANIAFSPDGNTLFFTKSAVIARVPIYGGIPQAVVKDVWSSFALSPDGRQVAFIRGYNSGQEMRLLVTDLENSAERELARSKPGELWFAIWGSGPAWSPDGQKIVIVASAKEPKGYYNYLLEVQVGDGSARKLPGARWNSASCQAWLPDGSGLVVSAQDRSGAPYQLWLVDYPSGEMRRVTHDLNDYDKVSISPDSHLLVAQQETNVSHIWVVPAGDAAGARQLTSGASDGDGSNGLAWTPDGRILFGSTRGGAYNIWTIKADGADERQLTFDAGGTNWGPRASPDGHYIVFTSNRAGWDNIWRMDVDGSHPVRLTFGGGERAPHVSPDGHWVYYTNFAASPAIIERIPIEGGEKQAVLDSSDARDAVISPDGTLMVYEHFDDANGWHTTVVAADGSGSPRFFNFDAFRGIVRWTADSRSLVYIDHKHPAEIWRQPVAGGPPSPFARFGTERISYFDLSPDGNRLVVARGNLYSDVVLITNFR
jgi:Tol biopolymer transport system component